MTKSRFDHHLRLQLVTPPLAISQKRASRLSLWLGHFPGIFAASAAAGTRSCAASFDKQRQKHARGSRCSFASLLPGLVPCSPRRGEARRPQAAAARLQRVYGQQGLCLSYPAPLGKEPALQKHPRSRLRGYQDRLASGVFVGTVNASSDWIIGRALLLALARF